ncbi:MAG: tannase/feruloyl esterase family alpha/beta hydrolase [Acidobacteria bacterium]|nr:MAG: tannase/feruloyl esterase family alpha/beta hydrolase [Acidobacteriota bacterium]
MIGSIVFVLLGAAAAAATPCENLASLKLADTTITSAVVVPEGPPPARGGGGGAGARGGTRGGGAPQAQGAVPQVGQQSGTRGGTPPANIPAHCRVQMVLKPTSDSMINMELWLPTENWNGKFMGVGNGGFAGSIQGLNNEMPQALRLGYATAGTDTGHQEPGGNWAIGHPEKLIDFAYRSTHEMTVKAKQIVKAFYDQNAKYSYFKGCSTGGRMALMEAQRYPDDYDGIIAGSLANRHIHMWTAGVARSIQLSRHPEGNLTAEKAALVNQMVTNTCDTLKEGFLNNPRQCKVDFSTLLCAAGKDDNTCLTASQLKTVDTYYGGVKNSKGELIFSGQALGNPIGALRGTNQSPGGTFDIVRIAYNDPNLDWQKFDLDKDMPIIDKAISYVDAVNPDLSKFKKSGGKLILTHGWADTGITPETTIWYYDSVLEKMGKNQSDWMRLFMVPGMGHCGGGPGVNTFDSIGTIEKWVEKSIAPDQMLGTGAQGLTRPLCPYPQYAEYKGTGDLKNAASWACKAPAPQAKAK